jgi:sulfofructose kinase
VLDADVAPQPVLERLVPLAQWVAFSQPGLALWAGLDAPADARACDAALAVLLERHAGPDAALVTQGAQGARWIERGHAPAHCEAVAVQAVDTTGAGDVFHAALALALAEGRAADDAVAWACTAAAFKCERGFGAEGAPTRQELAQWVRRRAAAGSSHGAALRAP